MTIAKPFSDAAANIDRNGDSVSAAWCVVFPPDPQNGLPEGVNITNITLGSVDVIQSITLLQARLKEVVDNISRMPQGFGKVR